MRIIITKKPVVFIGRTKKEVTNKILQQYHPCFMVGSKGKGYVRNSYPENVSTDMFYGINYQKFNKKTKVTRKYNQVLRQWDRKKVREGHWKAFVYEMPLCMLKTFNQMLRNFTFQLKEV